MVDENLLDKGESPGSTHDDPATPEADAQGERERLHKFLASTGAGSRRECETFIAQGRVSVNGRTVAKMGVKVDPYEDVVMLDGERVRPEDRTYYLLNKPAGYICTNSDERGRPRAVDLVRDERRIYTVGRLDADSTGLVLLTNDGAIANVVCHPRYRIEKRYQVHVRGNVNRSQIARVEAGVWLAEGKSSPAMVRPVGRNPKRDETILEMTLFEGRNREIRRVFAKVGLTVRRLQRTSIGPLQIGELPPGGYRKLTVKDLAFVGEAEHLYLANQTEWDAELPSQERRRPKSRRTQGHRTQGHRAQGQKGATRQGQGGRAGGENQAHGPGRDLESVSFPKRGRRVTDPDGGDERGATDGGSGSDGGGSPSSDPPSDRRRRHYYR